jgi:hypothetical protein
VNITNERKHRQRFREKRVKREHPDPRSHRW